MAGIKIHNPNKPNSERVVKILNALKIVIGSVAGAAYLADNPKLAFFVLLSGGIIDALLTLFSKKI